jgi:hypothetical protein
MFRKNLCPLNVSEEPALSNFRATMKIKAAGLTETVVPI